MDINVASANLAKDLDKYEWFYDTGVDQKAIIVYCDYINSEVYKLVPDYYEEYQIKIWFTGYLLCGEKYGKMSFKKPSEYVEEFSDFDDN